MPTKDQVVEVLKTVHDPELNLDIWTLELVYDIQSTETSVYVRMTLTSPMCPYGPELINNVKQKISALEGIKNVYVEVVFTPPWQPSDDLKDMLMSGVL